MKCIADKPYGLVMRGWGADLFIGFFHKLNKVIIGDGSQRMLIAVQIASQFEEADESGSMLCAAHRENPFRSDNTIIE